MLICAYLWQSWKRVFLHQFHFEYTYKIYIAAVWFALSWSHAFGAPCLATRAPKMKKSTRAACFVYDLCVFILNFCDLNFTDGYMCEYANRNMCSAVGAYLMGISVSERERASSMIIVHFVNWTVVKLAASQDHSRKRNLFGSIRRQNALKCATLQFAPTQIVSCLWRIYFPAFIHSLSHMHSDYSGGIISRKHLL